MTGVLIKERSRDTDSHTRKAHNLKTERSPSVGTPEAPGSEEEGRGQTPPHSSREGPTCWHLDLGLVAARDVRQ